MDRAIESPPASNPMSAAFAPTLLTIGRAEAPGCRDHRERRAAVHRPEVVLHMRTHVGMVGTEGRLPRARRVWGKSDQGDI